MASSKIPCKNQNPKQNQKRKKKKFPRASRLIAQVFSTAPHPLSQANTHHPPPHTWTSGWARRALEVWGQGRNPAQPQAVGSATASTVLGMYCPQNTHPLKGKEKQPGISEAWDWQQGSPTLLLGSSLGYERGCKHILTLCPNFQLNQKLDIQGKSQECGRPGVGTLLPQFPSGPTSRIQATWVCLLNSNILRVYLKRKSSIPDFE